MKTYSVLGNKKKVSMDTNTAHLKVIGNNCVILVTLNHGEIEVIGNDCKIEVEDNYGKISLVGANGAVVVARRWTGDRVQTVGKNSHVIVNGKKNATSYEAQLSPFSKELDDVIESIFSFVMR